MDTTTFIATMAGILGGLLGGIAITTAIVYWKGEALIHRIHWKEWVLPCPNCRDENDEPTGYSTPDSPVLQRMAQDPKYGTEDGELPAFACSECGGTKVVRYEYPRSRPPQINERQMITSALGGKRLPEKKRGW